MGRGPNTGLDQVGTNVQEPSDFTEYVSGNAYRLKRIAYVLAGNDADAEDLMQTALAKLYLVWPRITARGTPDAYVRRALVTTHREMHRRHWWRETPSAEPQRPDAADAPVADGGMARVEDRSQLLAALASLTVRQREAVVLRYYADLSERDTAETLGCSVGTVKALSSRGLAALRAALNPAPSAAPLTEALHGNR
jgi:RNA polymerase sigma-70 factor (sigma-E family)